MKKRRLAATSTAARENTGASAFFLTLSLTRASTRQARAVDDATSTRYQRLCRKCINMAATAQITWDGKRERNEGVPETLHYCELLRCAVLFLECDARGIKKKKKHKLCFIGDASRFRSRGGGEGEGTGVQPPSPTFCVVRAIVRFCSFWEATKTSCVCVCIDSNLPSVDRFSACDPLVCVYLKADATNAARTLVGNTESLDNAKSPSFKRVRQSSTSATTSHLLYPASFFCFSVMRALASWCT
jgi:hypothetical protein